MLNLKKNVLTQEILAVLSIACFSALHIFQQMEPISHTHPKVYFSLVLVVSSLLSEPMVNQDSCKASSNHLKEKITSLNKLNG